MSRPFKILTWNLHCASATSAAWDYLLELDPDVALLQEVGPVPPVVTQQFACRYVPAMGQTALQKFYTVILVRGEIGSAIPLTGPRLWIDAILAVYTGNLLAHEVDPRNGPPLKVMSAYSPSWPIPARYLDDSDLDALRRTQQRDVWLTDVLLAALEHCPPDPNDRWIIGGDLNLSETFTRERGFAGGNGEWLARMSNLGLTECLREAKGVLTPTFRHTSGWIEHQIDHLFVTEPLASRFVTCDIGSQERVFASPLLSDHLPIMATFAF